ncbi:MULTISPECIES: hydrogenase maturation protease [unclassified Streptomyces]|uniref:hydrogenase maturation protease n=1 Tax=unclassified Streptomyces TaxID=2593676 RepID=UPI001F03C289|nr:MULTISPECIES: hydrogenase maturation protease [unclassified Streptomyces]MCH0566704.1 hydrogenase maturation protease [Streptomyces sp. MUM 2J]MCH0572202.1 hydrogenase maturation protease [Streptomyces sp. MUM 136J]
MASTRLLVAGIGNIFLADDAFGPEVIAALREDPLPAAVEVRDFGIRGLDLAYRLLDGYDAVVFVDAAARGHRPGTLSLVVPEPPEASQAAPEAHGMDPVKVLALAARMAEGPLPRIVLLACEPEHLPEDDTELVGGLSAPVREAVAAAVPLLHTVVRRLLADPAAPLALGRPEESAGHGPAGPPGNVPGPDEDHRNRPYASKEHA